jgi:hypothetical protein
MRNLHPMQSSGEIDSAATDRFIESRDLDIVRNLTEELARSTDEVQMRFKLRTIQVPQNVDDLSLAAATS